MSLTAGARIGPYEVTGLLGEGGMGEVYRAHDGRLKRDVALKVLPASFAADPDRVARFQREAEVLASLNHPHIAQVHGFEDAGGVKALVMELVEGPTLADRIAGGALAVDEALAIAAQIAEALEAAHEQGIVHRDLKPANVKVRADGTVKVLDFGLAKALAPDPVSAAGAARHASLSPTITTPPFDFRSGRPEQGRGAAMTQAGVILGTAAYMAPEQARGRSVDRRADIWAFGCVLYEMLTGRRVFAGEDVSMTLAMVLQREPDLERLPPDVPPRVRQAIRVCLQKDPKRRAHAIGDVRLALDGAFETTGAGHPESVPARVPVWRRPFPLMMAASLAAAVLAGAGVSILTPRPEPIITRFAHDLPAERDIRFPGRPVIALSPDGRHLVYNTEQGLRLRAMDDLDARVIPGTEPALTSPFFSPDGRTVGYFREQQLWRIAVTGGAPVAIGAAENPFGVDWAIDGTILFAQPQGIMRVRETGGTPDLIIPAQEGEQFHGPQLLPGGDAVLFSVTTTRGLLRWDQAQVVVQSLRSGERTVVLSGGSDARYVPTGHLVYARGDILLAVPFDVNRRVLTGVAVLVAQGVQRAVNPGANTAAANYAVSDDGTLVYLRAGTAGRQRGTLTWVARDGSETPLTTLALEGPRNPRLSPDGDRVAVVVAEDLWVHDVAGRPPIRLTAQGGIYSPVWTPDGQRIVAEGNPDEPSLLILAADGSDPAPQVASPDGHYHPFASTAAGELVATVLRGADGDIVRWPLSNPAAAEPVVATPAQEGFAGAALSADRRWLAFTSNQTGQNEIWVRPYPGPGAAVRVSPEGGVEPVWARNGRELFYLEGPRLMAVAVTAAGDRFDFSPARRLLEFTYLRSSQPPSYDVAPDGRFLMIKAAGSAVQDAVPPRIVIVQHWFEELTRLVPRD